MSLVSAKASGSILRSDSCDGVGAGTLAWAVTAGMAISKLQPGDRRAQGHANRCAAVRPWRFLGFRPVDI